MRKNPKKKVNTEQGEIKLDSYLVAGNYSESSHILTLFTLELRGFFSIFPWEYLGMDFTIEFDSFLKGH